MNNDIENQINDLTSTSPAETQQVAQEDLSSKPDKNATTHMYGIGLEGQDAPILQEEASAEGRGIDMSQEANGLVVGTAIPNNTYNTSYVSADKGSELLFNPNVYDPMPYPMLQPREKEAIAAMKQAYIMVEGNRVPEDYIGYTPLPREGSLSMWSHTVGNVQNTTMNLIPMTIKSGTGVANAITYGLGEAIKYPLNLLNKSAYANTAFGRWANNLSNYIDISGIQASSDRLADAVDKTLDPVEQLAAKTYDADLSDNSIKANIGRGFGSGLVMLGLGIGMNSPTLAASIFNLSELNAMKNRALDAGVSPAWAHAYSVVGAAAMTALDVVEIMGGMGTLTLTYKAGRDYLKHLGKRGTLHYLGKEAGEMGAEAGVEMVQETIEGWYDPEFRENPVDRLFVAGVSAVALRGLGVVPSIRHAKLADQAEMAAYYGVTKEYNDLLKIAKSVVDDMVAKGVIDPSQYNEVLHSMISEAPDTLVETLRLGVKGSIDAIPEEERRNFAQTLKAIQSSFGKDVFSPETMQALDTETEKKLAGIRNGLSNAGVDMIKGIVRGTYVMSAIANANNPKYKFNIPDFVVSTDPDGASYFTKDGKTIGIHESRSNTENTNISPDFAGMVRSNFIRSTAMSDKMASILHEMSHWIDYSVGKKGFTDFLEHYYNNIAKVFGNDKAAAVYNKSKKGKKRWTDEPVSYTDESRASEYFAQAVARLGKRSAEAFGLGKSEANEFLSYANIMLNQLANLKGKNGEALITSISDFQSALQNATRTNMGKLANLIDVYGSDNIKRALKNFNSSDDGSADFAEYLASKDMLSELFDVMNGFADASGAQKIDELFDNDQDAKANFVTMGDQLFREGYDTAVDEVRQRRKEARAGDKAKPKQAKADPNAVATLDGIIIPDAEKEQVAYASTAQPLEGNHLDADRYYSTGEADNQRGGAMRWGYGNYLNKSPVINRQHYYNAFLSRASKKLNSKLVDANGKEIQNAYMDDLFAWLETLGSEDKETRFTKSDMKQLLDNEVQKYKQQYDEGVNKLRKAFNDMLDNEQVRKHLVEFAKHEFPNKNPEDVLVMAFHKLYDSYEYNYKYHKDKDIPQYVRDAFDVLKDNESVREYKNQSSIFNDLLSAYHSAAKDVERFNNIDIPDDAVLIVPAREAGVKPEQNAFLIPDNEYFLNAQEPVSKQTKFIKDRIGKIADKYNYFDSDFATNPNRRGYDMDIMDLRGEDVYNWLANEVAYNEGLEDIVDRYRFASNALADEGIKGIHTFGARDNETFNVFKSEDTTQYKKMLEQGFDEDAEREAQDWAKAAMAKDSVEESFKAGEEPKKPISADIKIDGRDLGDDITMAQSGLRNRLANPLNKITKWAASSPWGWGLDRILVTILGRDTAEKFDVAGKYGLKQEKRSGYWDEFMTRLMPLFGNPKTKAELMFKYKTMTTDLGFVRMKGLEIIDPLDPELSSTKDITGWEAMYVYLMKEQGFGDRIQKSTTTNINDIIATLSEEEKAFALEMSNQLMSMYEKTFGKSKYEHYFPILSAEHELFDELSIDSLTARMNTDDAIAIYDAGRIFSQYISRWASHESGYFETMRRVRDTFRYAGVDQKQTGPKYAFDPTVDEARIKASAMVANSTRQVIGEDGYRNLINLITSELQDSQERMFDASRNHALTQMGNNIVKSILSNKIISFPKNVSNLFMMWGGAKDQGVYWNNFAEGWGNAKSTYEYMMKNSSEIRQRWNSSGGINEYLDQKTLGGNTAPAMKALAKVFAKMNWTNDKTQNMAKFSAAMDMLGDAGLKAFMQSGDMIANVYGGYGLVKDYMAQGMSEAEAFKKLDRYIVEHQSSSNLAMKPLIQKKANNSILGQVFAFTSEGVAKWASILGTFDEVKMGTARKSEAIANLVSIAISMALYSALAAGVWDLFDDDEKVREDAQKALVNTAIDQVFSGFVAGNAMITPAISYLVGDSRISGMSVPIYNFAIDGITSLKKGEYDKVVVKAMSAAGLPVGADNLWNTLLGASMLNDKDPDIRYAGKLMTLGYTQNRASKRADVKKEKLENNSEE